MADGAWNAPVPSARTLGSDPRMLGLAWAVEGIAVAMGLVLAFYAGVEGTDGGTLRIVIAILPFLALSLVELAKIPLVALSFRVRTLGWRVLAVGTLLAITVATFENFVFGFERGFNERIRQVEQAEQRVRTLTDQENLAAERLSQMTEQRVEIEGRLRVISDDIEAARRQAVQDIALADDRIGRAVATLQTERERIEREIAGIDKSRVGEVTREQRRCANNPNSPCRIAAIEARHRTQRALLDQRIVNINVRTREYEDTANARLNNTFVSRDADVAAKEKERARLADALDALRAKRSGPEDALLLVGISVGEAKRARDDVIDHSQLHRLSLILFRSHAPEAVEKIKRLFIVSLAAIIAATGSIIAAMHYAATLPFVERRKSRRPLSNAIRQYLLSLRRRRIVRVVIRDVPIDRLKVVYLPIDASEAALAAARHRSQELAS